MVYHYTSAKRVITQLLGITKMTDATYADDLLRWLGDGISMYLRMRQTLTPDHCIIEVEDHIGDLPCGLVFMDGLLYNGSRLRKGTGAIDTRIKSFRNVQKDYQSYFVTDPKLLANEQDYKLLTGDAIRSAPEDSLGNYYIPFPNHIQTSFKCGCIQLFYRKITTDKEGYPMIPDDGNIRFGLVWFLMSQLSMSGYKHNNPEFNYAYCEDRCKEYMKKGIGTVRALSTDQKEALRQLTINLIPPRGYYENFGIGFEQPKYSR